MKNGVIASTCFTIVVALLLFFASHPVADGEIYKVTVTREESNFYRVDGTNPQVYIQTKYCYEYAYSERALIDTDDMEITFLDSNTTCSIVKILRE